MTGRRLLVALVAAMALGAIGTTAASAATLGNGDFETGSLAPWTTASSGPGSWSVSTTGTASCGGATNAPRGSDVGLWNMSGSSWGLLTQTFTVPAGGAVSVDFAYHNYLGSWIQAAGNEFSLSVANQWLRIDVLKSTATTNTFVPSDILATIFDSQSGSPAFTQGWTTGTASLAAFAGQDVTLRVAVMNRQACLPVWIDNVVVTGASGGGATTARAGYCAAAGDTSALTGAAIAAGSFIDLADGQPDADPHYAGATLASFVAGKGLTCDPPPAGYVLSGTTGVVEGTPGPYAYWAPPPG